MKERLLRTRVIPLMLGWHAWAGVCAATAFAVRSHAAPAFHEHVEPLLHRHCSGCHRPDGAGPFSLLTLGDARKHGREMVDVTARRFMPPWLPAPGHAAFEGERRLSEAEIAVFRDWLAAGMPEGDPAKAPPTPEWPKDWEAGPPDLVARMPLAYPLPASGKDVYRHFVIPISLDRKRYVTAWQVHPRSRAVHHLFLRLDRSGEGRRRDRVDPEPGFPGMDTPVGISSPPGHFASWQPGAGVRRNPVGMPWALEPGTDLVIQVHLQPLGRVEPIQIELGFYLSDTPPTQEPIKMALIQYGIDIGAGTTNVVAGDEVTLPAASKLLGVLPHSHYLGRRIEARAHFPGGRELPFFLIPDWDFNWQGDYLLKMPLELPAGTRLSFQVTFDNSDGNPRNPFHPPQRVRYGPNTTDEMAELWLLLLPATPSDGTALGRLAWERGLRDSYAANEARLAVQPRDASALVNQGRVHLARREYAKARARFVAAAEADVGADEPHYYLGVLWRLEDKPDRARTEFLRAVELNPHHAKAQGNLGLLEMAALRWDSAAERFGLALQLDPRDTLALGSLGQIRLVQGRTAEAEALFRKVLDLDPKDAEAKALLERVKAGVPGAPR